MNNGKLSVWLGGFIISSYILVGCLGGTVKPSDIGSSPKKIEEAAKKQEKSTIIIDEEASKIIDTSKEDTSKASAGIIKEANVDLKNNVQVLKEEAKVKDDLQKKLAKANATIKELKSNDNKFVLWICRIAVALGVIAMAVGAVIFVKTGFSQWEVLGLGASLTVASAFTMWFFANIIWFIIGIFIIALIGVVLWVFLRTDEAVESAVHVGETLKKRIKKLEPIDNGEYTDEEKYVLYEEVMQIITDVFGDDTHHGIAGTNQSKSVVSHITAKRKKLHKKVKSIYQ